MNINEATLFPELEHQLIYLQHRKLPDPGAVESYERFEENVSVGSSENTERENISVVNEEPHPDVDNIVNRHLSEYPEMADAVIASVKDTISAIDWWKKESAISEVP